MKATITKSEITSASVARGIDKQTGRVFFVVRSDSDPLTWYTVTWSDERLQWCCNCPATCSGCKHSRAVNQVLAARRATIAVAMSGQVERPTCEKGNLNGGGRAFSLLR